MNKIKFQVATKGKDNLKCVSFYTLQIILDIRKVLVLKMFKSFKLYDYFLSRQKRKEINNIYVQ